jgi:hypothetical protein
MLVLASLVAVAPAVPAGETPYRGPSASPQYLFCTAIRSRHELPDETIDPGVIYYSGAFVVNGPDINPAAKGFLAWLKQKYAFEPDPGAAQPVSCTSVHSLEEAQSLEQIRIGQSKKDPAGKVVETGWVPQ